MKTLNEKMAELMGWRVDRLGRMIDKDEMFKGWLEFWTPDSDLNQAMEAAAHLKIDVYVDMRGEKEVELNSEHRCSFTYHNNTHADIARAICEGINEIMGGGDGN